MKNNFQKIVVLAAAVLPGLSFSPTIRKIPATLGSRVVMVEFTKVPSAKDLAQLRKFSGLQSIQRFDSWSSDYFSRLYRIELADSAATETEVVQGLKEFAKNADPIKNAEFVKQVVSSFALQPGDQTKDPTQDPYVNYQWGLRYTGQKIIRDYTDLQSDVITAGPQVADIGLDPRVDVDTLMKDDVVVGVMDSGVDLAHPDLVHNLYHNMAECLSDGSIPLNSTTDKDGNGYPGDCMGWNFVGDTGDGDNRPDDDYGHGTHVAGIIAAEKNNKVGVSGVSNKLKILPIRVTWAQESPGTKKSLSLTDRIAKGILYAAKMKAKVVNISLGWPNSADAVFLRNAFAEAIKSGVTIVAAAGNNSTNVPVFPCDYAGVICVAATSLDGRLAPFSNYGSHVDISAPGEEILSTYPVSIPSMGVPPAAYFSDPRYEILSGTSMAAPYVTAAVGVLKGIYPNISENEIKARLFASSQSMVAPNLSGDFASAYIQYGTLKLGKAISIAPQTVVAPDFKGLDRVTYSLPAKTFVMNLPITSYWTPVSGVRVTVTSQSPQLQFISGTIATMSFSESVSTNSLKLIGRLTDLAESSQMHIKVQLDVPGQASRVFVHDFQASRSLINDPNVLKIPVSLKVTPKTFTMMTLKKVDPNEASEFYWMDQAEEVGKAQPQFHIMRNSGSGYAQLDFPSLTPEQTLLSLIKVPTYGATGAMYWMGGIAQLKSGSKYISYHYYDKNLRPIATFGSVDFTPETVAIDQSALNSLSFLPWQSGSSVSLPVPVFQTVGGIPAADQDKNWTHFQDKTSKRSGIYFLVPQKSSSGWSFQTRLFDNADFVDGFRTKMALDTMTAVEVLHLLPQGADKSKISAIISYGKNSMRKYAEISVTMSQLQSHTFTVVGSSAYSSTELDHAGMTQVQTADATAAKQLVFTAPISQKLADLTFVSSDTKQVLARESLTPSFRYDSILALISSFSDGHKYYSFMESTAHLLLHVTEPGGKPTQFETNIHRSSLLPGEMFSESFHPVRYTTAGGAKKAAVYADATQISSNQVYVYVADDQKGIVSPLSLNVDVPPNCVSMAPQSMVRADVDDIVLLCRNSATSFELRVLPIAE